MTFQFTPISLIYLLATVINLFTALINWRRQPVLSSVSTPSLVIFVFGLWLMANFFEIAAVEPSFKLFFLVIKDNIGGVSNIVLLLFAIDYFKVWHWFTGWWRRILWFTAFANCLIGWTNSFHHWYWTDYQPGPAGSNILEFNHGPLWVISSGYFIAIITITLLLIINKAVFSSGHDRQTAIFLAFALVAAFFTYLLLTLLPNPLTGLLAIPFGFSIMALVMDWIVVEDFRIDINEKTSDLELSAETLRQQIVTRELLENDLRHSQEFLSMQLASQSAKLTDVYDMILISNQISSQHELIQASLSKITDLLGCQIASFFGLEPDQNLHLEAWVGDGFSPGQMTDPIRSNWLPITPDVRADHSTQHAEDLPIELKQKECDSALFKWVIVQDRPLGILAVYWKAGYRFAVEEITLVSALTDGLGLIVENARLRQAEENEATTQERHRLARDLHDSVTQSLHSLVLSSQNALKENRDPERLKRILRGLDTGARQALKEMRLLLFELRLTRSEEISLVDRLKNRLDEVEHRAGIQTELHVEPGLSWPKEWDTELYPLAMEALNNSLKHARASNVSLRFSSLQDIIQMEIQDDGIGFDLESVPQGGMGLKNFAERCQHLGAHLEIISSPSNGTTIRVKIREQSQKNFQTTLKEKADE